MLLSSGSTTLYHRLHPFLTILKSYKERSSFCRIVVTHFGRTGGIMALERLWSGIRALVYFWYSLFFVFCFCFYWIMLRSPSLAYTLVNIIRKKKKEKTLNFCFMCVGARASWMASVCASFACIFSFFRHFLAEIVQKVVVRNGLTRCSKMKST